LRPEQPDPGLAGAATLLFLAMADGRLRHCPPRLLPGPMATLHLADLGADVIKVEDTGAGDYASPAGVAALLQLCRGADVLIEGFRPGVMQPLGLGYDTLAIAALRASGALA
jgi:crotonobetainyl-CoA:carnitine CoA-transferase CaiB-like acyl-CoA transferase